ncbi:MAG: ribosome small subunit-dependent GTPase A [Gemmatimonadaceae bacterium]
MRGIVLRGTGGIWRVRTDSGETHDASLRGRLKQDDARKLAVGDEVVLEEGERGGAWAIAEIAPRRSRLVRRSPGGAYGERIVATNIDQVVIVFAAAQPEPHPRMLDRFLVVAEANELPARVVINKADLAPDGEPEARFAEYARIGYPLHVTSVKRGSGLAELRAVLVGGDVAVEGAVEGASADSPARHARVSALSGPSGVGKSSLLNALFPGFSLRVGEISRSVNKGRHTTVGAELHPLPPVEGALGGYVVDTPGLREVGVWGVPPEALDSCFPEFRAHLGHCRFGDCTHAVEPGCAVRAAVERGEVSAARHESYLKLRGELAEDAQVWPR